MLRVVFHDRIASLSPDLVRRVDAFLATFLAEGTVRMAPAAYHGATMWALALDDDEIIGFAAQRLCDDGGAAIIQVMGTFLAPRLRGSLMASTLLQGKIFLRTWMRAPFRPIFWCTRTRIPAVYRTATLFNDIYPKFDDPVRNRAMWVRAARIARLVYGDHTTLDPDTFAELGIDEPGLLLIKRAAAEAGALGCSHGKSNRNTQPAASARPASAASIPFTPALWSMARAWL